MTLLTGRGTAAQWHTQTRTSNSAVLRKLYPEKAYVEVNPLDADAIGIQSDENVIVESQRGRVVAKAVVTATIQASHVFMPMHYDGVNQLTFAAFDPISSQPAYKACAVRIKRLT